MARELVVWKRDEAHCEQVLLDGGQVELTESGFSANDFVLGALMDLGLWDRMVRMYPNRLKQDNGYDWRILNRVALLRELMDIRTISGTNKVLSDPRLVAAAGFNLAQVSDALDEGRPVMDSETLANHLARIDRESSYYTMFEYTRFLRQRHWIRGKVFAADAKWITVEYGRDYDGMGAVGDAHGYKLEVLFNVHEGRELFAGFVLGPLNRDEREMLLELFDRYEQQVGAIRELIEILLVDRGYWGARFFETLVSRYGLSFVSRPRDPSLTIVQDLLRLVEADRDRPKSRREYRWRRMREHRPASRRHPHGEVRQLELVGVEGLRIEDEDGHGLEVNAVVVYEFDEQGQPLADPDDADRQLVTIYITNLRTADYPQRIRKLYRQRWPVENQGFRDANQNWHIDQVASRVSLDAVQAALTFKMMVYNSERILRMKYPQPWREEKIRLKNLGRDELIAGPRVLLYTADGYMGIFRARRIRELVAEATRRQERQALKEQLLRVQRSECSLAAIIEQLDDT